MTTYILGAGPCGLAIADGLADGGGRPFVLLERSKQLGGLAQTVQWDGIGGHDLGPHKIFSLDRELVGRVERLLPPTEWLTQKKISSIFMRGHYLPYPPSPFSLSGVFGLPAFTKMVMGYGLATARKVYRTKESSTFEEDLRDRLGTPLYETLFKPIAEKLWGDPRELDVKLSKGRVQTPSLVEVLGRMLKITSKSEFEALTFRYPKGGLGKLWESIAHKCSGVGTIRLGCTIAGLETRDRRIVRIHAEIDGMNELIELQPDDFVVSSLPMAETIRLLGPALPSHLSGLASSVLHLNDLLLVFLHVDIPSLVKESWVFVPDPSIVFHRLSEQESFDPGMTPNGSIVCCEIMSSAGRNFASRSDEELIRAALSGLADMGYSGFHVLDKKVIRLRKSYPVFRTGFEAGLDELIGKLDGFENFRSIGRQGAFNYIGTLDAIDIGYGFVRWLDRHREDSWLVERDRTSHYPVLD